MWTRHGHLIPGTTFETKAERPIVMRCGGVTICSPCKEDVAGYKRQVWDMIREEVKDPDQIVERYRESIAMLREVRNMQYRELRNEEDATRELSSCWTPEPEILRGDNSANYQTRAMYFVKTHIDAAFAPGVPPKYDLYVVWFCKTLENWKALVGTNVRDGLYYEVTYDGRNKQTYLDEYAKTMNVCYPDEDQNVANGDYV